MKLKQLRRRLVWPAVYLFAVLLRGFIQLLPFGSLKHLAAFLGGICFLVPVYRRLVLANLDICFPNKTLSERRAMARTFAVNITSTFLEFLWLQGHTEQIHKLSSFDEESLKLLEKYEAMDQGLLAISPHIGNWEVGNLYLNACGHQSWAIARKQPNPFLEKLVDTSRRLFGTQVIHEKGAAKEMLRVLRRNETIMLLIDQNTAPHRGGIFVDFYGLPISVSRAPASFARKANANILIGACLRTEDRRFKIYFRELPKPVSEYPDDTAVTQAIMEVHKEFIAQCPDQYLWLYRRFRYIPYDYKGDKSDFPFYARTYGEAPKQA